MLLCLKALFRLDVGTTYGSLLEASLGFCILGSGEGSTQVGLVGNQSSL